MNSIIQEADKLLKEGGFDYAVCGGYAIELFIDKDIRGHGDAEIYVLKSALVDGLDVNFIGTQWEAEWLANNKVCNCKACNVARKCIADIEQIGD